ncbi:hypothetical protein QBC37DRAFT_418448 [Rhypophila decipiens]|uniref:Uncharacterized protein n=1 Tax=Rhypophila decipiens TaxID=261697 RepID=A0AAN6YFK6_9PEZI|nr:hypothetical protein QBC37DRAFT_418448 [Rhypophila decipiens]
MEFEMVEGLIEIGKWDGSFEPKDTRRLVGKYWFDWVASNLRVLDDSVLISTIAVLVVLNGDRYRVCDDMIEPLREKAEGFVRKIIEDEEYFNKVFKFATLGYELDVWKQPQAEEGYLQAFHDADTTEQGIESAEIKREGSTPFNREPHTVDAVQAPLSGFGNLNIHDQNSVQDFDDSDPSHTHRQYGNEQPATYDAPATPQPTQLYDRRHSVKTSSSSSRQHDQDRQKTGEKSTTSSRRPWYGPEATRDQVMNLTTDASRDEKKDKTQRTSAPSTSHLDGVSSYKTPHDRYHQRKEFDEMSQDHYHQPYDLTLQPQQDYANNHMQDSSYGNYDRQDLSSTTPPRDYHNDQTTDNCQNYYPQDHGQIAEVYENSQVHNQQNHVHGDDYNQEQNLDHPQAYSRPQSSSYPSQQSPEDTRFSQHSPGDIPRAFPEIPQAKASRDSSRRKQNSHGTGSRSSKNYRA